MTTEIHFEYAPRVAEPNSVYHLISGLVPVPDDLAALVVAAERRTAEDCRVGCLSVSLSLLAESSPGWRLQLLTGHTADQHESRILRHRKLWGGLEARGVSIPTRCGATQWGGELDTQFRWFGQLEVTADDAEFAHRVFLAERLSVVLCAASSVADSIPSRLASGWSAPNFGPAGEIIRLTEGGEAIVAHMFGEFDDRDVGVAMLARQDVITRLLRAAEFDTARGEAAQT